MDNNCPIEYKKGYTNFFGCKINLSSKCFIPKIETEFWVKKAIKQIRGKNFNILDIFSGSGCIGIAVLKNCSEQCRRVTFAEINKNLIEQIKLNLRLNKINPKRYKVIQSDIFKEILGESKRKQKKSKCKQEKERQFDYIFANPPYIPLKNKHLVQNSVLNYEPHLALFGGKDGLFYIKKFLKDVRRYLKLNGEIYMEFDHLQKTDLERLLKKLNYTNYKIYKDQFKKYRYVCIKN
ncbi:MAG TPA: HemK family protein methyltransferase [Candidatus Portnoybacteria bacterium]|jgi:release factor glutamine methyltransferase|nr:HemK family protein methyltransferase [Candidatus Portnoybacteria bacterium]MDD5752234.1 HemK family protein methyltransferase [Candidatus Portnoybacteria bacterium]HNU96828.1 HemK family protein methyltransferase [Candidatus Portnoybacteria bacterium]HOZ16498.1 HemK family protein methyltransferase [Candidatus Portnoybacteria bacterium]HPH52258.1 HemK family protein methyltransferase [Candidatus Portnoybacteria bacterium]